jgi:5-formyltetrahydrofolate cyclo-ligase
VDKAAWRRWVREQADRPFDPEALLVGVAAALCDAPAGWVLTYRPLPGEVDLRPLEQRLPGRPFALTRTGSGPDLTVHPAGSPNERHRWGFDQPRAGSPEVPLAQIAVVLVPGLAFDRRGTRLGHGLGYYDRLLARLPKAALRIGVIPSQLVVDRLPADDHDVPMTHVATEHGVVPCPVSDPGTAASAARPSP